MSLIYPLLMLLAVWLGGPWVWIGLPLNLLLIPTIDQWLMSRNWEAPRWCHALSISTATLTLLALANVLALLFAIHQVSLGMPLWQFLGLASTVGIAMGSSSLPAAHEMVHRRSRYERALGMVLLASASYLHFRIEHVLGHHRNVGTFDDPGTARSGEPFPAYFGRALSSGVSSAWRLEAHRLARRGQPTWSTRNRMLWYAVIEMALFAGIFLCFGPAGCLFMLLQSLIAMHILEAANYVQHFGVTRHVSGGIPEPVSASHCWDCESPLANILLFGLPMHAQHHLDPRITGDKLMPHRDALRVNVSFYWAVFLAILPGPVRERFARDLFPAPEVGPPRSGASDFP